LENPEETAENSARKDVEEIAIVTRLDTSALLRRAAGVRLSIGANNELRVRAGDGEGDCGPHALAVLDALRRPRTLTDLLDELRPRVTGLADWVDLMASIEKLVALGAVLGPTGEPRSSADAGPPTPFGLHVSLLNDRRRTQAYLAAIAETVKPGDVVLDLGSGTGILALAAARAGADQVYAIEGAAVARLAEAMVEANGLGDRVTVLSDWSTRLMLPRPANVLVSEIIGNEPFDERILEFTQDAVRRMLAPGARLIPRRLRVFGVPVRVPAVELARRTVTPETAKRWQRWYGIDFTPLLREARGHPRLVLVRPHEARTWTALGDPLLLADVDLAAISELFVETTGDVIARRAGRLSGLLVYFEADLTATRMLSTHPAKVGERSSWLTPVWLMSDGPRLRAGERVTVTYRYGATGREEHAVRIDRG
jgi:16S rRNA G966 N2-methylase RsmD